MRQMLCDSVNSEDSAVNATPMPRFWGSWCAAFVATYSLVVDWLFMISEKVPLFFLAGAVTLTLVAAGLGDLIGRNTRDSEAGRLSGWVVIAVWILVAVLVLFGFAQGAMAPVRE